MPQLDTLSLIFTNTLVALVVALVLLVSGLGLRQAHAGTRHWVAGDLALTASRVVLIAETGALPGFGATLWPFPVLSGTCFLLGVLLHLQALQRVNGRRAALSRSLAEAVLPALLFGTAAAHLPGVAPRVALLYGGLLAVVLLTMRQLWPLRALWGARLIGAMMVLALVNIAVRLTQLALGDDAAWVLAGEGRGNLATRESVVDLLIALVVSAGFLLLQQERLRERIERLVVTDALTGALNRHGLMPPLQAAVAQAERHGRELSVVLFDLDHFKQVNDRHGHAVGDTVLAGFVARVQGLLRRSDLFGRWGGEEFLLVMPDTRLDLARTVAERIRASIADGPLADGAPPVTVSGGAASASEARTHTEALLKLLQLADQRLYQAKRQRNQVVAEDMADR
jgi:diguanylate cyclase (GGDEF)-like protein